jgi:6-pyruvoyltetrahydropterin/6-carboxytetrahydropterin synthase
MHGHNYVIIVELKSETVDDDGFVTDYGELKPIKEYIDKKLDHRHLNHIMPVNPTAENIAEHLFWQFKKQFPKLSAVIVKETPKTEARYEPS